MKLIRFRSMKCVICDTCKPDVKEVICPMTMKYDHIEETVLMCDICYKEAVMYGEDERLP